MSFFKRLGYVGTMVMQYQNGRDPRPQLSFLGSKNCPNVHFQQYNPRNDPKLKKTMYNCVSTNDRIFWYYGHAIISKW